MGLRMSRRPGKKYAERIGEKQNNVYALFTLASCNRNRNSNYNVLIGRREVIDYFICSAMQMRTLKCHLFCVSMHLNVPYGTKQDINNGSEMKVSATAHAPCHETLASTKWKEKLEHCHIF